MTVTQKTLMAQMTRDSFILTTSLKTSDIALYLTRVKDFFLLWLLNITRELANYSHIFKILQSSVTSNS